MKFNSVLNGTSWNSNDVGEIIEASLRWLSSRNTHPRGVWESEDLILSIHYSPEKKISDKYTNSKLDGADIRFDRLSTGEMIFKVQLPRPNRLYDKKALASLLEGVSAQEAGSLSSLKAGQLLLAHLIRNQSGTWDWESRMSEATAYIGEEVLRIRYVERKKKSQDVQLQRVVSLKLRLQNARTKIQCGEKVMRMLATKYQKKKNQVEKTKSRLSYYETQIEKLEEKLKPKGD